MPGRSPIRYYPLSIKWESIDGIPTFGSIDRISCVPLSDAMTLYECKTKCSFTLSASHVQVTWP